MDDYNTIKSNTIVTISSFFSKAFVRQSLYLFF